MSGRRGRTLARKLGPALPYAALGYGDDWAWIHTGQPFGGHGLVVLAAATMVLFTARPLLVPRQLRMAWRQLRHGHRPHIPARLRRAVYAADSWACVACGATGDLQLDHVRPWSCGGLTCLWNMVTLCGRCNRVKSNYWRWPSGAVTYQPFAGEGNLRMAAAILAIERRARRSPWRWTKAAFTLA